MSKTKTAPAPKTAAGRKPATKAKRAAKPRQKPLSSHLEAICDGLAGGKSLRGICAERKIGESTVRFWLTQDDAARARVTAARELGCDALADECIDIADGRYLEPVDVQAMKVRIDTRLRLIGKWSQRYGDKVALTGADGGAIQHAVDSKIDMTALNDEQLRALATIRIPAG